MQLVLEKIAEKRTNQRFILLEGFCNSNKLDSNEQRLQLRFMDEFFTIQKNIGEVFGVLNLTNEKEETTFEMVSDMFVEKVEEEVKGHVVKAEGEDE